MDVTSKKSRSIGSPTLKSTRHTWGVTETNVRPGRIWPNLNPHAPHRARIVIPQIFHRNYCCVNLLSFPETNHLGFPYHV